MSLLDQFGKELKEKGDEQQANVHPIYIGIGGKDDIVVPQVFYGIFYIQGRL